MLPYFRWCRRKKKRKRRKRNSRGCSVVPMICFLTPLPTSHVTHPCYSGAQEDKLPRSLCAQEIYFTQFLIALIEHLNFQKNRGKRKLSSGGDEGHSSTANRPSPEVSNTGSDAAATQEDPPTKRSRTDLSISESYTGSGSHSHS